MSNIIKIIKELPALLPLKPATESEIVDTEIQLCLHFAVEYKEYLAEFGAILADGIELTGIAKSEHRNVVLVTKQEWKLNINVPRTMYVIENVAIDGIVIWQNWQGEIFKSTPHNAPVKIAESLVEYLEDKSK